MRDDRQEGEASRCGKPGLRNAKRADTIEELFDCVRRLRGRLPADLVIDRDEANQRSQTAPDSFP